MACIQIDKKWIAHTGIVKVCSILKSELQYSLALLYTVLFYIIIMTKKSERLILGGLVTVVLVLAISVGIYYASSIYSTESRVTTTSNLLPRRKGSSIVMVPLLTKNYNFTVNGGIPNFECYPKNPLSPASGKQGYVVCDSQVAGAYVAIMWRDSTTNLTIVQDGMIEDLLASSGAKETLGSGTYTKKDTVCTKDVTFKDVITTMDGMFVDCVIAAKSAENTSMYISYFYFTPQADKKYGNVAVFSNIGSDRKIDHKSFMSSTRDTIKYLTRSQVIPEKTSYFNFNKVTIMIKKSIFSVLGIEIAYATGGFGGGCCSGGVGSSPSVTFTASPSTVSWNTASTLSWSSLSAVSCTASGGWSGVKGTAGTESTPNIRTDTTYTITCVNSSAITTTVSGVVSVCPSGAPVAVASPKTVTSCSTLSRARPRIASAISDTCSP